MVNLLPIEAAAMQTRSMDSSDRAAGTAYWIAAARAQESAREDRVFDDPFAEALAGEIGRRVLAAAELASGGANPYVEQIDRWLGFDALAGAVVHRF